MALSLAQPRVASYVLGHATDELNHLIEMSRYFGDLTAQVLHLAGLHEGMRVLDIGCGAGDVSFLAAAIVGLRGSVTGVDQSAEAVALATSRAAEAGLTNVTFVTGDAADLELDDPVDALVGRLALMCFADPAVVLRRLTGFVRPGGVVAFQELDMEGAMSVPSCPTFDTAVGRIKRAFTRAGVDSRTGLKLGQIFEEAGLSTPHMLLSGRVDRGLDSPLYEQVAQITRTLLPVMARTGVATPDEVGIETLAARIGEEAAALNATVVSPPLIGAWTRTSPARGSGH